MVETNQVLSVFVSTSTYMSKWHSGKYKAKRKLPHCLTIPLDKSVVLPKTSLGASYKVVVTRVDDLVGMCSVFKTKLIKKGCFENRNKILQGETPKTCRDRVQQNLFYIFD